MIKRKIRNAIRKTGRALVEGNFFLKVRYRICRTFREMEGVIDKKLGDLYRTFYFRKTLVVDNRIVFWAFQGDYTDNPKYIAECLHRKYGEEFELIWIGREYSAKHPELFPSYFSAVYEWGTKEAFEAIVSAKFFVFNSVEIFKLHFPKKKGQTYIQTWHGSLGIKRFDKKVNSGRAWVKAAEYSRKVTDYLISNSEFESNIYRESFWPDNEILMLGHPRNDLFFKKEEKVFSRLHVFEYLEIEDKGYRILLYAPTFRDDKKFTAYSIDYRMVVSALEKKFGGKWIVIYRYHPTVRSWAAEYYKNLNFAYDATEYPDIQDLLNISDVAITDYSSWIFDFLLTGRPGFIYATDLESYTKERGFAYSIETTPFSIAKNNEELIRNIEEFDLERFCADSKEFTRRKGCVECGDASEQISDLICKMYMPATNRDVLKEQHK